VSATTAGPRPLRAVAVATAGRAGGIAAVAAITGAGIVIARMAAAVDHGYLVPGLVRAWANWVAGPLSRWGLDAPLHVFFTALAAYVVVLLTANRIGLRWIAAGVVVLHAVFLLAPPMLSTDIFNYVDVARLGGRYHLDPYIFPPHAERHDAVFPFLHWRHAVTDYGPLFTLAVRPLGHLSVAQAAWVFKTLAALSSLGCAALAGWIAHRRGGSAAWAVAAFGLNPVVLVWTVAGAHNDLLMLLFMLAGTALLLAERPLAAGATLVAAAAVKLSAGLAIPFLVLRRGRGRLELVAGLAAGVAAVAWLSIAAFPDHAMGMITQLQRQQMLVDIGDVPQGIAYALHWPGITVQELHLLHAALAVWIAGWLIAVVCGGDALAAIGWALLGIVVTSTWFLPWYLVWPLGYAAASGNRRLLIATCAVGASYAIGHAPLS
jgi:alpha-1,6-mannosyltransferase